jgi:hypothetical protein
VVRKVHHGEYVGIESAQVASRARCLNRGREWIGVSTPSNPATERMRLFFIAVFSRLPSPAQQNAQGVSRASDSFR